LECPVLPDGSYGWGIEVVLARTPATSVEGEKAVDEGAQLGDVIWAAVELLVTEAGAVEETVDYCDAMVPGFH
jgi:hypothetical protein